MVEKYYISSIPTKSELVTTTLLSERVMSLFRVVVCVPVCQLDAVFAELMRGSADECTHLVAPQVYVA